MKDYYILTDASEEWRSLDNGAIWVMASERGSVSHFRMVSPLGTENTNLYRDKPANFSNHRMKKI